MTTVVGVDGARSGWVSVQLRDGRFASARYGTTIADRFGQQQAKSVPESPAKHDGERLIRIWR